MNGAKLSSLFPANVAGMKQCCWMQAGVVDYKLCDREYDCEHCPFDEALHGKAANPGSHPADLQLEGSSEQVIARLEPTFRSLSVGGCAVAGNLFYHPRHTWARIEEGGTVRMGIDDFGQRLLGRAYSVALPAPNTFVGFGEECGWVTHQAGVTALAAPVSGKVKENSAQLHERPALLNRDPYGEGWTTVIEPTDLKGCLKRLRYGQKVRAWQEREIEKLKLKVSELLQGEHHVIGTTMNDGGLLTRDFMSGLSAEQVRQVISSFFPCAQAEAADRNHTINAILVHDRR